MNRTISKAELERRKLVSKAKLELTECIAMIDDKYELTYIEWLHIFNGIISRSISILLKDEWRGD